MIHIHRNPATSSVPRCNGGIIEYTEGITSSIAVQVCCTDDDERSFRARVARLMNVGAAFRDDAPQGAEGIILTFYRIHKNKELYTYYVGYIMYRRGKLDPIV